MALPLSSQVGSNCMCLGKTFQVSSMLMGFMKLKVVRRVLIVAPVSVLASWKRLPLSPRYVWTPTA